MMKALITGSNGFIGSHLVEFLLDLNYKVFCLVRKTSDTRWIRDLDVHLVHGDLGDKESIRNVVRNKDYVFHLAGIINAANWDVYYTTNYIGTKNIAEVCAEVNPGLKRFVYVSSISASGPSTKGVNKKEEEQCRPINDYGKTKLLGEQAVKEALVGVPYVIIRPPNVLGPREKELYSVLKLLKKRIKPLLGNGDNQTSICFVKDLVRAILLAAQNKGTVGKTYFITDGKTDSWRKIAEVLCRELGMRGFILPIPYPALLGIALLVETCARIAGKTPFITRKKIMQIRHTYWTYDGTKAEEDFGFKPLLSLAEGIKLTVNWYKKEGLV
jgi:nucleoside-diphosphate-sugar epimerase